MKVSRRSFLSTASLAGLSTITPAFGSGIGLFSIKELKLDQNLISLVKANIENEIVSAMEKIYLPGKTIFDETYRPGSKYIEKVVSYYDYQATGIPVLAVLAAKGE